MNHWNAQIAFEKWKTQNLKTSHSPDFKKSSLYLYQKEDTIPLVELEKLVVKAAQLVKELGEEYLDFFHRAEQELAAAKQKEESLQRIQNLLSKDTQDLHGKSNLIQPLSFLRQSWTESVIGS